ncbi:hypothetical protein CWB76_10215 [Pseudoalteromonas sp. S1609]|uniref:hypothetical protein n=1 Tax=Pseudoalteromonas sp. S1609 TaxID=579505 RepID=UPI00110BF3BA|nr:hypothetical protein [Pseudoalteromonas sp. S1609]TMP70544.1 hypothetical protein CWB76_10215 [Pseudoalteromonas sp. S1609]
MALSPINPNDAIDITHALYAGTTGSCKSVATQKIGLIKANDQVAFWDLYGQYKGKEFLGRKVRTYSSLKGFLMALHAGRKTKQGFKIAFTPNNPPKKKALIREMFLKAAGIVWAMGNGLHPKTLHFVAEEINRVTISSGDEDSIYGEILEAGRKFNIMCHSVTQRLAPIPNTVIAMSGYKWIGRQDSVGDAERVAKEIQLKPADIMSLTKFKDKKGTHHEYYFKETGFNNTVRSEFVFKNAA